MDFSPAYSAPDRAVALIGTGPTAVGMLWRLRSAGLSVRWFCGTLDVAEEVLLASSPPGALELVFADPRGAKLGDDLAAVVSAAGSPLDELVAARARENEIAVAVIGRPDLSTAHLEPALALPPRTYAQTAAKLLASHPGHAR